MPHLQRALADKATVDLKPFASNAQKKIAAVISDFQKNEDGVPVAPKKPFVFVSPASHRKPGLLPTDRLPICQGALCSWIVVALDRRSLRPRTANPLPRWLKLPRGDQRTIGLREWKLHGSFG